jgi:hypothetical protein
MRQIFLDPSKLKNIQKTPNFNQAPIKTLLLGFYIRFLSFDVSDVVTF